MKKSLTIKLLALFLCFGTISLTSCTTLQTTEDVVSYETGTQTPKNLIVAGEKAAAVSDELMDSFLISEYKHRAAYAALGPKPHEFANWLRVKVPDPTQQVPGDPPTRLMPRGAAINKALLSATDTFRLNRTTENRANLQTALATVNDIIAKIKKFNADAGVN